jgi:hypothetical protein
MIALPAAAFVEQHWGRRAVLVGGSVNRLHEIYDVQDWHRLRHVGSIDAAIRDANGVQRQIAADPHQVSTLLAAGMTICADVSAQPTLASFLADLTFELQIASAEPPFAKLYVSPDAAGFAMHMDAHHVFVLQLEGEKTWWYGETPALPWTLSSAKLDAHGRPVLVGARDGEPLVDDDDRPIPPPDASMLREVTLTSGDCLYLPPGTWHTTQARGGSIALSVSPPRAPASRFLLEALAGRLGSADWRTDLIGLPDDATDPAAVPPALRDVLTRRSRELGRAVLALDARDLQRTWCASLRRLEASSVSSPPGGSAPKRGDRLAHAPGGFRYVVAPSPELNGDAVFIYRNGIEWLFPAQAHAFVRELGRHPTFVASDVLAWDPELDWAAAREVLTQLLAAGIIEPVSG